MIAGAAGAAALAPIVLPMAMQAADMGMKLAQDVAGKAVDLAQQAGNQQKQGPLTF
ncbi:hypothetical protein HX864_12420 [Pseudomonas yamanorum]|jgi:hypothetical protein|uniref:hypothetical protein n=1 Tax=Pseudomonas yamanorum TaxID=515393 RepID=UPI0015A2C328|nr:hypothetical protein [Pseudomonas yamanorum]NWD24072.1 hypothetical protein [Pseudomonas yamanorum]